MIRILLLFLAIGWWSTPMLQAQVRKFSNEFLTIGVGAKGMAMSGAQVASVDDVTAGYFNPAGLVHIRNDYQVALMHSEYFAGIAKYDYGAFALPLNDGKRFAALSVLRFAVDDIPNTLELFEPDGSINYDNIKAFSVGDYAFLFSYAQLLPVENLSLGGNFKVIYRNVGSFANAWGFGLDAGLQYRLKNWRFGFSARDITGTFNAWSFNFTDKEKEILVLTDNDIPSSSLEVTVPRFIFGAAYSYTFKEVFTILPEINLEMTTDGKRNVLINGDPISFDLNFGLELDYSEIVYLRTGLGNFQKATDDQGEKITSIQPNIGLGIQIKSVKLDYAFTDIGDASEGLYSHVISLALMIDKKAKE